MCQNFDYSALYARFYAQAEVRAAVGGMLATTRGGSGLELCRDTCSVPTGTRLSVTKTRGRPLSPTCQTRCGLGRGMLVL